MRVPPLWLALACAWPLAGCQGKPDVWLPSWDAAYSEFQEPERQNLARARRQMERGRVEAAWRILSELLRDDPDNIEVGCTMQEVQLALIRQGSQADSELASIGAGPSAEDALRRHYAERVERAPAVSGYVLAARLETDAIAAVNLLDRALELDPGCAWAHYGRAHALLRQVRRRDRWRVAREALARALEFDPNHIAARRLDAWMLAQEGETRAAVEALRIWLEVTQGDARLANAERVEAEVDLATLLLLRGRTEEAIEVLRSLEGVEVARPRRLALLAVAEHEGGNLEASLVAARRAERAAKDPLLALVQQALLAEHGFEDAAAAEAAWNTVLDTARSRTDLSAILQAMRARVVLERRRRAEAEASGQNRNKKRDESAP